MIQYLYLGRVAYDEALRLQEELVELRHQGRIDNMLLLLEHPPVLTLGRNANRSNILASDELLASRGVTLHEINRGGDVTYHGPGQLIGYPIFDLRSLRNPTGGRLGPGRLRPPDGRSADPPLRRLRRARRTHLRAHRRLVRLHCSRQSSSESRADRTAEGARSAPSAFTSPAASPPTASPSTSPPI